MFAVYENTEIRFAVWADGTVIVRRSVYNGSKHRNDFYVMPTVIHKVKNANHIMIALASMQNVRVVPYGDYTAYEFCNLKTVWED